MTHPSTLPVPTSKDSDSFRGEEIVGASSIAPYDDSREEEWMVLLQLIDADESCVEKLRAAGVSNIASAEAFGKDSISGSAPQEQSKALHAVLSPVQMQKLLVISAYLSNQGKLQQSSTLDEMVRFNLRASSGEPPAKRGRGRPRKSPLPSKTDHPSAKRPRGRPRKEGLDPQDWNSSKPERKKGWIGRPRKDGKQPGTVTKEPRPIGRPRKDGLPPKGPTTRPEVPRAAMPPGVKRPRGRPRKDGLPPGSVPSSVIRKTKEGPLKGSQQQQVDSNAKRPRGRPRKDAQLAEPVVKKPRGRPRKESTSAGFSHSMSLSPATLTSTHAATTNDFASASAFLPYTTRSPRPPTPDFP
ncbi:AT hook motif-containing protein [Nitzschia inconspicua]|uniref:AT hook motif-containing protein n=1 Tax=Nitzschia inconspicua TaxID=303405 RepID=A0A9K3PHG1_9STRA|nr:AT hook motif-containing protein [Nitzschia inconspicua]